MIRNRWEPDSTQKNSVMMPDLVETVRGHHLTGFLVISATPGKLLPLKLNARFFGRRIDHSNPFRHHLLTNSVSLNRRYSIFLHVVSKRDNEIIPATQRADRWLFVGKG